MVPNGWNISSIDSISDSVKVGFVGSCQKDYRDSGIPLIRTTNLKNGKLDLKNIIYVTNEFHIKNKKSQLKEYDLLIARHGNHGSACMVPKGFQDANCLNIVIVRPDLTKVAPEFMLDLFNYSLSKKLSSKAAGSTQTVVNTKEIASQVATVPPLSEQRKIAKILSTWDKAISTTERLIDNSKQQKKALMQQLLTGKKRLLDDSGKQFEGEWEEVKLGDVVLTGRGYAFKSTQYSESGYKIVRVTNVISSGKIDLSDCVYIPDETAIEFKKYELYQDDVLLVMVGATAGKLGFVSKDTLPALLNQNMWSLRTKDSERLCQIFLRHVIYQVVAKYLLSQQGSARGFFTQKTFESVKFSIPTIKEQQKVASVLSNADREIEVLEQQLTDLKQEKKALMQQLLTGKRRVKTDDKAVA